MELLIIGGIIAVLLAIPKKERGENAIVNPTPVTNVEVGGHQEPYVSYPPGYKKSPETGVFLPETTGEIIEFKGTIGGSESGKVIKEVLKSNEGYYAQGEKQSILGS